MDLVSALRMLDPNEDAHWTSDDVPRISFIEALVEDNVKRQEIVDVAPDLTRETAREPEKLLMNREMTLEGQLINVTEELREAEEKSARLRHQIKLKQLELEAQKPKVSEAEEIQSYLRSEMKQRIKRFEARAEFMRHLDTSDLDPRSPLDAAMARKRARGTDRPRRNSLV